MTGPVRRKAADHRHRVALLVPSSNTVMENDLHRGLPSALYTIHTGRMYLVATTREAEIAMIEDHAPRAADDLGTARPDLLVFGCTSAGSLFGLDYDASVCRALGERAGCPALGVISAASEAIAAHPVGRLAVITPYVEDLTQSVAKALAREGMEIVRAEGMGISDNVALADPTPDEIAAFCRAKLSDVRFDALFISCTNFRSLEARARLEAEFGVPVITSNSAVIAAIRKRCENHAA
jgi:maleate isomerase